jgi:hypothetical protein
MVHRNGPKKIHNGNVVWSLSKLPCGTGLGNTGKYLYKNQLLYTNKNVNFIRQKFTHS